MTNFGDAVSDSDGQSGAPVDRTLLAASRAEARIPVTDLDAAEEWYRHHLGIEPSSQRPGYRVYDFAEGALALFTSTGKASGSSTQLAFQVADLNPVVSAMRAAGVIFETYPDYETVNSIAIIRNTAGDVIDRTAWFRDPDGNLFAVIEFTSRAGGPGPSLPEILDSEYRQE